MIDWKAAGRPIIALAPMADMTDLPFSLICKQYGTPVVFREMVSSEAIVRGNPKTMEMARFDERERPIIQQIFGSDTAVMAEAAHIIDERYRPDGIDINMGCPVYNLVSNFNGAALMRDPERASAIVRAIKSAIRVPLSVKIRLGWKDDRDCIEFVKVLENAGADLISVHGRTKEQGYAGTANWDRIGDVKRATSLPVLVNGDITTVESAVEALRRSGADGVLVGRGGLGNPWFFRELVSHFRGEASDMPSREERMAVIREHARLQIERYGEHGLIKLRKHLPWYFKGSSGLKEIRSALVRVSTMEDLEKALTTT
jgi:tRNA-dihydrouridine synthase B